MSDHQKDKASDEDDAVHAVPLDQRMGKFSLTMAWWGVCSAMFYIVVAATLARQYGTINAMIGMLLSVVAYGAINGAISRYAIRSGLSVALFSRILFGNFGAILATFIFFATALYYGVFESSVMAVALVGYQPQLPMEWAYLIVVVFGIVMIFGSVQSWLDKLNGVLLPFYLLGLVAVVSLAIGEHGYSNDWLTMQPVTGASATGWWNCFTYYMGVWILMMYTFDYARFGRPEDARYHARFNFGMPFYLVTFFLSGTVGIFLANTIRIDGEAGVVLSLLELMGLSGLVFVWVTQTRINTANFHLATTNLQAFVQRLTGLRLHRWMWAIAVGVLAYVIMLADVFTYILQALAYQGVFVVAWVGVALVHVLGHAHDQPSAGHSAYHHSRVSAINPRGLLAWFSGVLVGMVLMHVGSLQTFSAPATFLMSAGVYALMSGRARRTWSLTIE